MRESCQTRHRTKSAPSGEYLRGVSGSVRSGCRVSKVRDRGPFYTQQTLSTVHSFLAKAREALSVNDFQRAVNLADKARILADELARRGR